MSVHGVYVDQEGEAEARDTDNLFRQQCQQREDQKFREWLATDEGKAWKQRIKEGK